MWEITSHGVQDNIPTRTFADFWPVEVWMIYGVAALFLLAN